MTTTVSAKREDVWIGADPGGKNRFGIAILHPDGHWFSRKVSYVDGAMDFIGESLGKDSSVAGLGVDAPLWWCSGPSGSREADEWIRRTYKLSGGEVQAANSLRGAALVQGAMLIVRMRERCPKVPVTEAHPKALLKALDCFEDFSRFVKQFRLSSPKRDFSEDERDALVAAVAAREGFEGRWKRDLSKRRKPSEQDPQAYWLAPVHYFWPGLLNH